MKPYAICLGLSLLLAGAVGAQTTSEEPPTNPDETTPREQAEQAETPASEQATPPAAGSESEDSPFDYQASEQISEDLSVSFPIDI